MRVLIVEDEASAALRLQAILLDIDHPMEIVGICESIQSTLEWFAQHQMPELIFLDIQLSDGISFDIFKQIEVDCPIVFVTAFDEYGIEAFQLNSLDYLLKPYTPDQVKATIQKYEKINHYHRIKLDEVFFKKLSSFVSPNYKSRFYAKKNDKLHTIAIADILLFSYDHNATTLVDTNLKKFVINYSLDALEKHLDPKVFFRINRNYMIHIHSIKSMQISHKSRITITLKNQSLQIVSKGKSKAFKGWLDQ